ncbi:MAG: peptide chain release factor N(5)-glutamine methyltransferase [Pseudohongiellaceae bacterium]
MTSTCVGRALAKSAVLRPVSETARLDTELLLLRVIGGTRADLHSRPERVLSARQEFAFEQLLARRLQGEPVAYILGWKGFWDMELAVDPRVLIPRPETELLVEIVLELYAERCDEPLQVADFGTGSGAIALALARENPAWRIIATDVSREALAVAQHNAAAMKVSNVHFVQASWCKGLSNAAFDLIVSNPPYIKISDPHLRQLRFEPRDALAAGSDGLQDIRQLVRQSRRVLKRGGWLLMEHGYDQQQAVADLVQAGRYDSVQNWRDLAGHARVTGARWEQAASEAEAGAKEPDDE